MSKTSKPVFLNFERDARDDQTVATRAPASTLGRVIAEVCAERARNRARWGEQNYPSSASLGGPGACLLYGIPTERAAKETVARATKDGCLTWADVLLEEFAEAVAATDDVARRGELVQVAAVALAWIECIDRRAASKQTDGEFRPTGDPRSIPALDQEGDYYVLVKPWAVYVKEGHFFESEGGHTAEWGKAWRKVRATSIEDARRQGYRMPPAEVQS